jgi:hypothetical protein
VSEGISLEDEINELCRMFVDEAAGWGKRGRILKAENLRDRILTEVASLRSECSEAQSHAETLVDSLPKDVYEGITVVGSVRLSVIELDGDCFIGLQRHGEALDVWEVNALGLGPAFTSETSGKVENPLRGSIHSLARAAMACAELRERALPREADVEASSPNEVAVATEAAEDAADETPEAVAEVSGEAPTAEPVEALDNGENSPA